MTNESQKLALRIDRASHVNVAWTGNGEHTATKVPLYIYGNDPSNRSLGLIADNTDVYKLMKAVFDYKKIIVTSELTTTTSFETSSSQSSSSDTSSSIIQTTTSSQTTTTTTSSTPSGNTNGLEFQYVFILSLVIGPFFVKYRRKNK